MNFCLSLKLKAVLPFHIIFEYCYSNWGDCMYSVLEGQTYCRFLILLYKNISFLI